MRIHQTLKTENIQKNNLNDISIGLNKEKRMQLATKII